VSALEITNFHELNLPSFEPVELSPSYDGDFRGVKICLGLAPGGGSRESRDRAVLYGICRVAIAAAPEFHEYESEVVIIAVDEGRLEAHWSTLGSQGSPASPTGDDPPTAPGAKSLDQMEDVVITSFFNADLVETLELPEQDATYVVYVALGPYVSNAERVTLKASR